MRIIHLKWLTLTILIVASTAMAYGQPGGADRIQDAERIQELNERWLAMVKAGDAAGIAALHTKDARLMPPGAPTAVGREAIRDTWSDFLTLPALSFGSDGVTVADSGDMAYDTGWIEMTLETEDEDTRTARGKYVVVWEKRNGDWLVAVDILNMDDPN